MNNRNANLDGSQNLTWCIIASIIIHGLLLVVIPKGSYGKPFKIYPLANAGVIELGPSGGIAGGGLGNSKGFGGEGTAHFLNEALKKGQRIDPKSTPPRTKLGKPDGNPDYETTEPDLTSKAKIPQNSSTSLNAKSTSQNQGRAEDVVTSPRGVDTVPVASDNESGKSQNPVPVGKPDGSPDGHGADNAQGALAGPGGPGNGPGGPGGPGNAIYSGDGKAFIIQGAPPVYPKYAESNNIEGRVGLKIVIGGDGRPSEVTVIATSGESSLDNACVRAIKKEWRFQATGRDYQITLTMSFKAGTVDYSMDPVKVGV